MSRMLRTVAFLSIQKSNENTQGFFDFWSNMTSKLYLSANENYCDCEYFKKDNCNAINTVCYRKTNNLSVLGCKTRDINLKALDILVKRLINSNAT